MKDKGFKFYWIDRYTQNLYAKDLIWDKKSKIDFLTCFECLEHFKDPKKELKKIFSISKNVLFSTTLLPQSIPTKEWDYYGFNHGQHIAFYEEKTMKKIAEQFKLNYYRIGNLHLLTEKKINIVILYLKLFLFYKIQRILKIK